MSAALAINVNAIPEVFSDIFSAAFHPTSIAGGVTGTVLISVLTSMRTGIARGIYTNEAGLGSSPIVSASAKTNSCVRQGLISMTGVFFTTIVVCTMTGIVVLEHGQKRYYEHVMLPNSCHGTGDIYASAFVGALVRGKDALTAAKIAADYTMECIRATAEEENHWYGAKFEPVLGKLIRMLEE